MIDDPTPLSAVPAAESAERAERAVDEVPEEVRQAARRAFAERDRQAEIMPLEYDSLFDTSSTSGPRQLAFSGPIGARVTATVHASEGGEAVQVEITSLDCSLVEVQCGEATFAVAGRGALVGPAPHGLFSAVLSGQGQRRLRTSWIRV